MRAFLSCVLCVMGMVRALAAVDVALDLRDIDRAVAVGMNRSDRDRARFHAPYRVRLSSPPFDDVDVVTPFRRIVLLAEETTLAGNRIGQREALALFERTRGDLEIRVALTFHPLNTYVGVPAYEVTLRGPGGRSIAPTRVDRVPRFGARVDGVPQGLSLPGGAGLSRGSEPMLGGTIVATFDAAGLDLRGAYQATIAEAGKVLESARVDLASMR